MSRRRGEFSQLSSSYNFHFWPCLLRWKKYDIFIYDLIICRCSWSLIIIFIFFLLSFVLIPTLPRPYRPPLFVVYLPTSTNPVWPYVCVCFSCQNIWQEIGLNCTVAVAVAGIPCGPLMVVSVLLSGPTITKRISCLSVALKFLRTSSFSFTLFSSRQRSFSHLSPTFSLILTMTLVQLTTFILHRCQLDYVLLCA